MLFFFFLLSLFYDGRYDLMHFMTDGSSAWESSGLVIHTTTPYTWSYTTKGMVDGWMGWRNENVMGCNGCNGKWEMGNGKERMNGGVVQNVHCRGCF